MCPRKAVIPLWGRQLRPSVPPDTSYRIRLAGRDDADGFLRLVAELARFEKLDPPDEDAQARLIEDAFGRNPRIEVYVAAADREEDLVGYAIVLETYSSFLARPTLYIEDIYLTPDHRGTGLADAFMARLAKRAVDAGCGRIEGIVLGWNERARGFYARTGGRELDDWVFFRYDRPQLERLARGASS